MLSIEELKTTSLKDIKTFLGPKYLHGNKSDKYIKEILRIAKEMTAAGLRLDVTLVTRFGQETMSNLEPSSALKMVLTLIQRTGLEFKLNYTK